MTLIAAYNFARSVVKSDYLWATAVFAVWIAALLSGSVVAIVVGLVAYLRPHLLAALLMRDSTAQKPRRIKADLFSRFSFHRFAAGLAR